MPSPKCITQIIKCINPSPFLRHFLTTYIKIIKTVYLFLICTERNVQKFNLSKNTNVWLHMSDQGLKKLLLFSFTFEFVFDFGILA